MGLEEKLRHDGAALAAGNSKAETWHEAMAEVMDGLAYNYTQMIADADTAFNAKTPRLRILALAEIRKAIGAIKAKPKLETQTPGTPTESFIAAANRLTPTGWEKDYLPAIEKVANEAFEKFMKDEDPEMSHAIFQETSKLIQRLRNTALQGEGARQDMLRRQMVQRNARPAA